MKKKLKIFIAGHKGMVGRSLVKFLTKKQFGKLILKTKKELNLEDYKKVDTDPPAELEPKAESEPKPEPKAESEPKPEPKAEPEPKAKPDDEPEFFKKKDEEKKPKSKSKD